MYSVLKKAIEIVAFDKNLEAFFTFQIIKLVKNKSICIDTVSKPKPKPNTQPPRPNTQTPVPEPCYFSPLTIHNSPLTIHPKPRT